MRADSSERFWKAAWPDRTAEMLKMMLAFSKASEYCDVGLWVNASNLGGQSDDDSTGPRVQGKEEYQVKEILMCCSSTGKRKSRSSS